MTLSTRIGSRVMLREFGGGAVELLGRAMTPRLFAAWQQLIGTAIDLWVPNFKVRRISVEGSVEEIRAGRAGLRIEADFRPFAHLSERDPRYSTEVERVVSFGIGFGTGHARVAA
ncbi:phage baseplate assembly protein W [Amorphus orientalis]|uniref:Phage baseplate assembly protein W n=1 Tax=Amorphus orientalis TaxID=649198 RepID=A0AAE3VMN6_9HYPH|nr:phage baseplate assembly protein W [Amorphus orientalis]